MKRLCLNSYVSRLAGVAATRCNFNFVRPRAKRSAIAISFFRYGGGAKLNVHVDVRNVIKILLNVHTGGGENTCCLVGEERKFYDPAAADRNCFRGPSVLRHDQFR